MSEPQRKSPAPGLVLVGFMGAGKSTVGDILADRLSLARRDVDREVVRRSGKSVADIFEAEGEERFRILEAEVIADLVKQGPAVISTGGGALERAANRAALAEFGPWVWLKVRPDTVWERVSGETSRPLLQGESAEVRRKIDVLMQRREPLYAAAELHVETDGATPAEVADTVCALLGAETGPGRQPFASPRRGDASERHAAPGRARAVTVRLESSAYPVFVGDGCLETLGARLAEAGIGSQALVVTNATVKELFAETVTGSLSRAGFRVEIATMPDGERHKNLETVTGLYDAALSAGLDRRGFVVALGGGVVGDTAGFLAATYMRGVPFVQVPTTLLAQVDASVGGKVGVNHPEGKNLIGAFHQPRLVMADVATLDTLPEREWRSGMAEVIKGGLIADAALFERVERRGVARGAWDAAACTDAVHRSVEIKADVVSADERESGRRALLNLGHTVGHAVEALTGYDQARVTHGEAVALGILTACLVSERLTGFTRPETERVKSLLAASGYPVWLDGLVISDVMATIRHDKKSVSGRITMALLNRVGNAALYRDVPKAVIEEALREQVNWAERGGDG